MRIKMNRLGQLAVLRIDQWIFLTGASTMDEEDFSDDEWIELYVAELPKPDGFELRWNRAYPFWNMPDIGRITSDGEGVTMVGAGTRYDLDDIEQEALIILAAVTRVRKEQVLDPQKERDTK